MTRIEHALKLYELALSVMRERGTPIPIGSMPIIEYRSGLLAVRYWPKQGRLDVWYGTKVLTVERWIGTLHVARYHPGPWELQLEQAAKVAA
jgi:hypothetical protein